MYIGGFFVPQLPAKIDQINRSRKGLRNMWGCLKKNVADAPLSVICW